MNFFGKQLEFRGREGYMTYIRTELMLLKREWMIILPCVIMQYVHGIFHNVAYWIQAHKLSTIQRFPLHDAGFALMPELSDANSHWSEYLVFGGIFGPSIILVVSIAIFKPLTPERPRFLVIILKRVLLHISVALCFRIASFLLTSLPGPAPHCRPLLDPTCEAANPDDPLSCVIPNPDFIPPSTAELFTNMDALNGCGDLMFSSHTIYTMSFIMMVSKYWPNKYLLTYMVSVQIAIAFLIVASRKHYSLDVFTALYVVPLLWFFQEAYYKDINNRDVVISTKTIREFYGVDVNAGAAVQSGAPQSESALAIQTEEGRADTETSDDKPSNVPFERKNSM